MDYNKIEKNSQAKNRLLNTTIYILLGIILKVRIIVVWLNRHKSCLEIRYITINICQQLHYIRTKYKCNSL